MITAVVTVIREDEVEPDALLFAAKDQESLDELTDRFLTALHSGSSNFIACVHSGLKPVASPEEAMLAGTEYLLDEGASSRRGRA